MKKIYFVAIFFMATTSVQAFNNCSFNRAKWGHTILSSDPGEIVFASQEEKDREIKKLEEVISRRKAMGYTDAQLENHYALLETYRNAKISNTNENEK